jgi:N-acetylglutamate synthase-like GNAT family acetyltransferase
MKISFLADHPEFIETLAPLVAEHWRPILTQETMASRAAKFRAHLNYATLPIAWVAHSGSQVFGTAALRVHDLPDRDNLTPWLGGVYVVPEFRNRGVGTALCSAVEEKAKELGISTLYLFTLDKQVWYGNLGWSMFEPCTWCGRAGDIMVKELLHPAAV